MLKKFIYIFLVSSGIYSSCITTHAGIATSNIPLNANILDIEYIKTDEIEKTWWNFDIGFLGFPLKEPPIDAAINELIQKNDGDALINIRYFTQKTILLFMTKNSFKIKADVIKIKKPAKK